MYRVKSASSSVGAIGGCPSALPRTTVRVVPPLLIVQGWEAGLGPRSGWSRHYGAFQVSVVSFPQHPDQHRPERPIFLTVDQELGECPAPRSGPFVSTPADVERSEVRSCDLPGLRPRSGGKRERRTGRLDHGGRRDDQSMIPEVRRLRPIPGPHDLAHPRPDRSRGQDNLVRDRCQDHAQVIPQA